MSEKIIVHIPQEHSLISKREKAREKDGAGVQSTNGGEDGMSTVPIA